MKADFKKFVSGLLAVSMVTSCALTANVVSAAGGFNSKEQHTYGVIGDFTDCNWWRNDIPMSDDDGDGVYTAYITNQPAGTYQFKVRADGQWNDSWGEYEWDNSIGDPADRTYNAQTNCQITVTSTSDIIKVTFDTTKVSDDALAQVDSVAHEIDASNFDEYGYIFWPIKYGIGDIDDETLEYGSFKYSVKDDNTVIIKSYTGSDTDVVIPSQIDGKDVTEISSIAFVNCKKLDSVTIPATVTNIPDSTFKSFEGLDIFGDKGSYAETFAKNKEMLFCTIPTKETVIGDNCYPVSIGGMIPDNLTLDVRNYTDYCDVEGLVVCYSAGLRDNEYNYLNKLDNMTMSIKHDDENCKVVQTDGYDVTEVPFEYSNGSYNFKADLGTSYALISNKKFVLDNHQVGVIGNFYECSDWQFDIAMDRKSSGVYTAEIWYPESGTYSFKIRLDESNDNIWGAYDSDKDSTYNSDVNYTVDIPSDSCILKITFDSNKLSDDALANKNSAVHKLSGANDKDAYLYWGVTITVVDNAEYEYNSYKYTASEDGNGIKITGYTGTETHLTIPSEINGKKVVEIGEYAFSDNYDLNTVIIPDGVTTIGEYAFAYCNSLENITIPDSVTTIGEYAFAYCYSLENITIPDSVVRMGIYAFDDTAWLNGQTDDVIYAGKVLYLYKGESENADVEIADGTKTIADGAFSGSYIKSVKIPDSVEMIGDGTFENCYNLKNVTIGSGLTSINRNVFKNVPLESITVSEDNSCFSSQDGILYNKDKTSLIIYPYNKQGEYIMPDSVISSCWFGYCTGLTNLVLNDNVSMYFDKEEFTGCKNLRSITIGAGVYDIDGDCAFSDCDKLENIFVSEKNPYYSSLDGVLMNKDKTEIIVFPSAKTGEFTIPASVRYINSYMLSDMSKLDYLSVDENNKNYSSEDGVLFNKDKTSLLLCLTAKQGAYTIPDSVTTIGRGAFSGCSGLTSVTIPDGIKTISNFAFRGCSGLTSVTIPDSVTTIGEHAFSGCSGLTSITIPDSVTTIGWGAFSDCSGLTSVTIPDSVTTIDLFAFSGCSELTSVTIPDSVTTIGKYAFANCGKLENITVSENNPNYSAQDGVLFNKDKTELIFCLSVKSGMYYIPDGVTKICEDSFKYCPELFAVYVPESVQEIEDCPFNIYDNNYNIVNQICIYGEPGSYAEMHAADYNIPFCTLPITQKTLKDREYGISVSGMLADNVQLGIYLTGNDLTNCVCVYGISIYTNDDYRDIKRCGELTVSVPYNRSDLSVALCEYDYEKECYVLEAVPFEYVSGKYVFKMDSPGVFALVSDREFDLTNSYVGVSGDFEDEYYDIEMYDKADEGIYTAEIYNQPAGTYHFRIRLDESDSHSWGGYSSKTDSTYNSDVDFTVDVPYDSATILITFDTNSLSKDALANADSSVHNLSSAKDTGGYRFWSVTAKVVSNEEYEYGQYTYKLASDNTAIITFYTGNDENLVIPSEIDGHKVTAIERLSYDSSSCVENITIPDSVTSISSDLFENCENLVSINVSKNNAYYSSQDGVLFNKSMSKLIRYPRAKSGKYDVPDSVQSISSRAFCECSGLTGITIADGITEISNSLFENCSSLTSVTLPDSISIIGDSLFENCSSLKSITIPDSVTSIGYMAFSGCESLTDITIPEYVYEIGEYAFMGCKKLESVTVDENNKIYSSQDGALFDKDKTELILCPAGKSDYFTIPDSVSTINESAISYNSLLSGITIGSGITDLSIDTFVALKKLTAINVSKDNPCYSSQDGVLFNKDKTTLILCPAAKTGAYTVPSTVKSIGERAFVNAGITDLTISENVESIDENAFVYQHMYNAEQYNSGIATITVSPKNKNYSSQDGVLFNKDKTILIKCLQQKSGDYSIPDGVTAIGDNSFFKCALLTSVTMPDSVKTMGSNVFGYCTELKNIKLSKTLETIGEGAFKRCTSLTGVTIPDSVTSISYAAFEGCTGLKNIQLSKTLESIGNCVFIECTSLTAITIPETVISIGDSAFNNCTGLKEIVIPQGVNSIGRDAFFECTALTDVIIPDSVTSLGGRAFEGCTNLKKVVLGNQVTSIEDSVFMNCKNLTSINIPASVQSIAYLAFVNCPNLRSIIIPDSVTEIESYSVGYNIDYQYQKADGFTIYGAKGSAAEEYANTYDIPFFTVPFIERTLTDAANNVSVSGKISKGVSLNVEKIDVDVPGSVLAYNITLINNAGVSIQPCYEVTVSIPCDTPDCKVVCINDDGTQVDMNAEYVDGCYVFTTTHFSVYAVVPNTTLKGDVTGDGEVNVADALMIARYDAGLVTFDDSQLASADVTGDGKVNIADALMIARYDAGLIDSF